MPNRILRDGIIRSRKVAALSFGAEVFYRRLMSHVDDYGRCEYDPVLCISYLYVFQIDKVSESDIESWVQECCASCGPGSHGEPLLTRYTVRDKTYLQINNFGQRVRSESKHPGPEDCSISQNSPSSQQGTVYFIRSGTSGKIKIGFTVYSAESRLSALQTGSAEKLELLLSMSGPKRLETELHRRFGAYRQNGEWFEASDDLLDFIAGESEKARSGAQMRAFASSRATTTPPTTHTSPAPTTPSAPSSTEGQPKAEKAENVIPMRRPARSEAECDQPVPIAVNGFPPAPASNDRAPSVPADLSPEPFDVFFERIWRINPNKRDRHLSERAMAQRFAEGAPHERERRLFEKHHALFLLTPKWRDRAGAFAPRLWQFVEDDEWKYPPPRDQPEHSLRTKTLEEML